MRLLNPVPGYPITTPFGEYAYGAHNGCDMAAPAWTPILAAHDGTVTYAGWQENVDKDGRPSPGGGYMVNLSHGDGGTSYQHQVTSPLVKYGERVTAGQVIGFVGSTGLSTGNHLHFERWLGGPVWGAGAYPVDPAPYLTDSPPTPDSGEEADTIMVKNVALYYSEDGQSVVIIGNTSTGWKMKYSTGSSDLNNRMAATFDTGDFIPVDKAIYGVFEASLDGVRQGK